MECENKPCAMGACSQSQACHQGDVCQNEVEDYVIMFHR